MSQAILSAVRVDGYEENELQGAVARQMELLGADALIRPGMKVLLKPNLITAKRKDSAAITHPAVVRAVALWLRGRGVDEVVIADSPGGPNTPANLKAVYSAGGYAQLSDVATLSLDTSYRAVSAAQGAKVGAFNIISPAVEADVIINLCKLKTHGMMGMTAGVKNLFGLIPGLQKPEMHFRLPDPMRFADMLIDLALTMPPVLTIVDAIDAMEGNGPTGGTPRHEGYLFAACDLFTLDAHLCRYMGFDAAHLLFTRRLYERKLVAEEIVWRGDEVIPANPPFRKPDTMKLDFSSNIPAAVRKPFARLANAIFRPYPFVDREKCIGCGKCAESCPPKVIDMREKKAVIDRRRCISCFCCQEMCPARAIEAKRRLRR